MCVPLLLLFFMSVDSFPLWDLLFFFFSVFTDKIHVPIGNFNIYILIYLGICIIKSFMKLAPAFFYFIFFFYNQQLPCLVLFFFRFLLRPPTNIPRSSESTRIAELIALCILIFRALRISPAAGWQARLLE